MPGTLFVVATPIGNLEDITLRALRVLRTVNLVAAEDTRRTRTLLQHYDIRTPITSLHEHNEREKGPELLARLQEGASIALVSDAGTPLVSDPGYLLVRDAIAAQLRVEAIPGPSAVIAAMSVAGLPADIFTFMGFAPSKSGERRRWLAALATIPKPVLFYEAPHRIEATLSDIEAVLGKRWVVIGRELTKAHESIYRGWVSDLRQANIPARGEFVVLVSDQTKPEPSSGVTIANGSEHDIPTAFGLLTKNGAFSKRDAVAMIARDRGISRQAVYRALAATDT